MSALPVPIEVFYSYANADEDLRSELDKHLSLLQSEGLITTWHKRQIIAGTDYAEVLNQHLNTASAILLLISADFLHSDYCYGVEMKQALERHKTNEAWVIPIILRPCDWRIAHFAHLQVLPTDKTPITLWPNRDEAFADVATGIRRVIEGEPLSLARDVANLSHLHVCLSQEAPPNPYGQRGSDMTFWALARRKPRLFRAW